MKPIRHLQGRYAVTEEGEIYGHFEESVIPIRDGRIKIRFIRGSEAESTFGKYGTRTQAEVPIDILFAWNGDAYVNVAELVRTAQMSNARADNGGV